MTWMCRGECGDWSPELKAVYIAANSLVALSYFVIPFTLLSVKRKGFNIGTKTQSFLWSAFIFLCGSGHAIENVGAFWWPRYDFFALWHSMTAVVSVYTAVTFPTAVKHAFERFHTLANGR